MYLLRTLILVVIRTSPKTELSLLATDPEQGTFGSLAG
jgi:hypothetical protein